MSAYSPLEIAGALLDTGEVEAALDVLNAAIESAPDDSLLRLRAEILARLPDRASDALADLERMTTPTIADRRLRVRLVDALDDAPEAIRLARQLVDDSLDKRDTETLLHLLVRETVPDSAADAISLLDTLPDTWNWLVWRGDVYAATEQPDQARVHYTRALTLCDAPPDDPIRAYLADRIASVS